MFCISFNNYTRIVGWLGEKTLWLCLRWKLKSYDYKILNNIWIPGEKGNVSQIDHIIVSQWGIFVIETKTFDGELVQCLSNAKRWLFRSRAGGDYRWYNPLHQNYWHIQNLARCLKRPSEQFLSIVTFAGTTDFLTKVPENVVHFGDASKFIHHHSQVILIPHEDLAGIVAQIRKLNASVPKSMRKAHNQKKTEKHSTRGKTHNMSKQPATSTYPNIFVTSPALNRGASVNSQPATARFQSTIKISHDCLTIGALGMQLSQELDNFHFRVLPDPLRFKNDYEKFSSCLVLSERGIYVVLHLLINAPIYGTDRLQGWQAKYKPTRIFSNPLVYNSNRITAWAEILHLHVNCFHSIVAFNDKSTFNPEIPDNVFHFKDVGTYIRSNSQTPYLSLTALDTLQTQINKIRKTELAINSNQTIHE